MANRFSVAVAVAATALAMESPAVRAEPTSAAFSLLGSHVGRRDASVRLAGLSRAPKLGFRSVYGHGRWGSGERIVEMHRGGAAQNAGLAEGDVIVAVNGRALKTANCWCDAIERAAAGDGWLTLKIRREQGDFYRTVHLRQIRAVG